MKKLLLVAFLVIFSCIKGNSQSLSVDTSLAEANIPDTVNYNANLNHTFPVNISGGASYTGMVYLMAGVDSSAGVLSVDTVGIRSVVNKLNDTIMFTINETYNNLNTYRVGGNVVVIWPIAATLTTLDTFVTNVYVQQIVGINENKELYNAISIYPNPTKDYIYIKNKDLKKDIKQVRILDVNGHLIYSAKFNSKIDITTFKKGIYFLDLIVDQKTVLHYKLIKDE